jgi:hypothetical protein
MLRYRAWIGIPQLREELMWDQVGQLHAYHGEVPVEVRLLKLTEEVGEAAEAFPGVHGLNTRGRASAGPVRTCSTSSRT